MQIYIMFLFLNVAFVGNKFKILKNKQRNASLSETTALTSCQTHIHCNHQRATETAVLKLEDGPSSLVILLSPTRDDINHCDIVS